MKTSPSLTPGFAAIHQKHTGVDCRLVAAMTQLKTRLPCLLLLIAEHPNSFIGRVTCRPCAFASEQVEQHSETVHGDHDFSKNRNASLFALLIGRLNRLDALKRGTSSLFHEG